MDAGSPQTSALSGDNPSVGIVERAVNMPHPHMTKATKTTKNPQRDEFQAREQMARAIVKTLTRGLHHKLTTAHVMHYLELQYTIDEAQKIQQELCNTEIENLLNERPAL